MDVPGDRVARSGFQRRYTKHGIKVRAIFEGRLDDKCPAGGFGAYLDMRVYLGSGTKYASVQASDEPDAYKVSLHLYEFDWEAGDIAWDDDVQRQWVIHP